METNIDSLNANNTSAPIERPDFLKIICILSFVATGLMILIYSLGSITLAMSQATIEEIWPQVIQSNPQFEDVDGLEFFHSVGLYCVYALIANIFSPIGVIMMWRMEKMGFYIYVVAIDVKSHFFHAPHHDHTNK